MFVVEVKDGEEVIEAVEMALKKAGIRHGAIVSFFGAFDRCCISNMPQDNPLSDILETHEMPLEVSGCGDIVDGKAHIHVVGSSVGQHLVAGHLHWAQVKTWFVKVYISPL